MEGFSLDVAEQIISSFMRRQKLPIVPGGHRRIGAWGDIGVSGPGPGGDIGVSARPEKNPPRHHAETSRTLVQAVGPCKWTMQCGELSITNAMNSRMCKRRGGES